MNASGVFVVSEYDMAILKGQAVGGDYGFNCYVEVVRNRCDYNFSVRASVSAMGDAHSSD